MNNYLKSFEYFRATAITVIVAGHCYGISGWVIDSFGERLLANMISGGTHLFVFISGFLFHHVFFPRFHFRDFIWKKIKNVYAPFLFLSLFGIALSLRIRGPFPEYYFGPEQTAFDQLIRPALLYLCHGGVFAYWYIPFIMCVFLLSPLFVRYIRAGLPARLAIFVILLCASLFLGRPPDNLNTLHSVVFFLPVYLFGILCSQEQRWLYARLAPHVWSILAAALVLAALQALFYPSSGDIQKPPFVLAGIDLNLLQKLALSLFLMLFLHRFEDVEIPPLQLLAASSFAIYFLHGWFIWAISLHQDRYHQFYGPHLLLVLTPLVMAASCCSARLIRRTFPGHSRLLIGW